MAEALSASAPVLFVEPPASMLHQPLRPTLSHPLGGRPPRVLSSTLAHLTTAVLPGHTRPGPNRLALPMIRAAISDAVHQLYPAESRTEPTAVLLSSRVEDLWSAVPSCRTLFYATDDGVAGAAMMGISRQRLVRDEAATLGRVDAIAVVSPRVAGSVRRRRVRGHADTQRL